MKLVSYNILDGGEGRADPLAEVIEAQKPDIVILVEADHPDVLDRIAKRLNMDVAFAQGKNHGAAILSRWPILESINHSLLQPGLTDCLLEAIVRDPAGIIWPIGAVHLHAHALQADEEIRLREIDTILQVFKHHRDNAIPHLLAGDFNANSPVQQINPAACKPRTREEWKENGQSIPRSAIQKLIDADYVDSLHALNGPAAENVGSFSTQYPGQRVDYIFSFAIETSRIIAATVEHDRLAKYASDHFPVTLEIQ